MESSNQNSLATPLLRTVTTTPTDVWNDSCSIEELKYSLANGAVGATTNPAIVLAVLKKENENWQGPLKALVEKHPTEGEDAIAWMLIEAIGLNAAKLLMPVFEREKGGKGRLSMQTNPTRYMDATFQR